MEEGESIVRVNLEEEHRGMAVGLGEGRAEEEQGIVTAYASDRGMKGEGVEIGSIIQTKKEIQKKIKK